MKKEGGMGLKNGRSDKACTGDWCWQGLFEEKVLNFMSAKLLPQEVPHSGLGMETVGIGASTFCARMTI